MRVWLRNAFVQVSDIDFEFRVTFKNLKSQPLHAMRRFLLAGLCAYVWESNSADEAEEDASLVVEPPLSQEDAELLQEAVEGSSLHCAEELPPASTDSEDEMREPDESDELLASPSAFRAVYQDESEEEMAGRVHVGSARGSRSNPSTSRAHLRRSASIQSSPQHLSWSSPSSVSDEEDKEMRGQLSASASSSSQSDHDVPAGNRCFVYRGREVTADTRKNFKCMHDRNSA